MSVNRDDASRDDDDTLADQSGPMLTPDDAAAVDALIEHGFDSEAASRAHPALRARIEAAHALLSIAAETPLDDASGASTGSVDESLVDATLARIGRAEADRSERMRITPERAGPRRRTRWTDFVAVACAALIALSIGAPLLNQLRHRQEINACAAGMREVGTALAQYAADFNERPLVAGLAPDFSRLGTWTNYDNSRHLDLLRQRGYCGEQCLCCGNDAEREGYASQVPTESMNRYFRQPAHVPLLADRNPFVVRTVHGMVFGGVRENSPDHGGFGQNVLYGDLSVFFEASPVMRLRIGPEGVFVEENIWVPADGSGDQLRFHGPGEWTTLDVFLMQ
jgi:hypothetical protein